jgi:hypothetical protein
MKILAAAFVCLGSLMSLLSLKDFAAFGSFVVVLGLEDLDFSSLGAP